MDIDLRRILRLTKSNEKKVSNPNQMALDLVEAGNNDNDYGIMERVTNHIPDGISPRLLYRDIIRIAWPSFLELTLTQLTSMVDMMMVGGWVPGHSGSGSDNPPKFLLMIMFMSMNVGSTALIARYKGSSPDKANMVLKQALMLTFALSAIASLIGFVFSESFVRFMGAADEITLKQGSIYLKIQMIGFVPLALTSTVTAALRGVGNSRTAMAYNLLANAVNVVFNYLLINGKFGFPRMEVAGASLATIIGQAVAFLLAMLVILRGNQYLSFHFRNGMKPDWQTVKSIFNIGIPAMVEQIFMRIGMIMYVKTVATLGTVAYATHQICMNIQAMSFMNGQAFAVSGTSLVGQSLGKRRPDMAQAYSSRTRRVGMLVSIVLGMVFFLGRPIVSLYTKEAEVIAQGARSLNLWHWYSPFSLLSLFWQVP